MRIIRIDHVSLNARDRDASLAWYDDVLEVRPGSRHEVPDEPVFLGPEGAGLALFAEQPHGLRHIALATDEPEQSLLVARLDRLAIRTGARSTATATRCTSATRTGTRWR